MRRALLIGAIVAVGALVLGFTFFGRGTSAGAGRPSLRVTDRSPLVVRGQHFRRGERVRLNAGMSSVVTNAGSDGLFVVTIPGADRCSATRVLARGSAGSYAVVKLLPAPACAPVRSG
jgi:altronate dehydratase